jgi:hypothetical protein
VRVAQMQQINVFSALNLNATTVVVPLGSDNIFAQAPIFRTGRPTTFPPGPNEGIFPVVYNPLNTPEIDWFLQGNMTCNGDTCTGPGAPADTTAPSITGTPVSGGTVTLNPGAWAGSSQVRLLRWIMACDDDGCSAADGLSAALSITGPTSFTVPATRACRDAQVEVWTRRRSRPRIRPACPRARRTASRTPFTYGVAVPPAS